MVRLLCDLQAASYKVQSVFALVRGGNETWTDLEDVDVDRDDLAHSQPEQSDAVGHFRADAGELHQSLMGLRVRLSADEAEVIFWSDGAVDLRGRYGRTCVVGV